MTTFLVLTEYKKEQRCRFCIIAVKRHKAHLQRYSITHNEIYIKQKALYNQSRPLEPIPLVIEKYRADGLRRSRCLSEADFTNSSPFLE